MTKEFKDFDEWYCVAQSFLHNPFVRGVVLFWEKNGYITERQRSSVQSAISKLKDSESGGEVSLLEILNEDWGCRD